ncbi:MAG: hypothetical protein KAJ24_05695 [Candidatus Aenigmarchaeota archaeon]|nr:hypothetical protein [Candidatus Aenigmarchaeota archaeon]
MSPNVKVTALQIAAFHDGALYTVVPNNGSLKQNVHIPGYVLGGNIPTEDAVGYFEGLVSDMGYPVPPSFSIAIANAIFDEAPRAKIRDENKIIGSFKETETFSPQFLYEEDPELVRETVESLYPGLEIDESDLQENGMQIIRLHLELNKDPTSMDTSSMYHSSAYRTPEELNKLNMSMSPTVKYIVTQKENLFE